MKTAFFSLYQYMIEFLFINILTLSCFLVSAQEYPYLSMAQEHLDKVAIDHSLKKEDLQSIIVSDYYKDQLNGITHIYLQQAYQGIPIENAIINIYVTPDNTIGSSDNRFYADLNHKIVPVREKINTRTAVINAAAYLGIENFNSLRESSLSRSSATYQSDFSLDPIEVEEKYVMIDGRLRLTYGVTIDEVGNADIWHLVIDASSGKALRKDNRTIYCQFERPHPTNSTHATHHHSAETRNTTMYDATNTGENYLVYPLPLENPTEGDQQMVREPYYPEASPHGWHDTDGMSGAEFTITKGNNAHAYEDASSGNSSNDNEPDGGSDLTFAFTHLTDQEPEESESAAITNLFYTNNMAHDLSYILGFTEAAGNFQLNNYGNPGRDNDYVRAEGFDGSGRNNANFSITPDGTRGRMQMFLFDKISSLVDIEAPAGLADRDYETGGAAFGPPLNTVDITAPAAIAITDGVSGEKTTGCEDIVSDVEEKVAIIDRGECDFSRKVFQAQEAGAVMAIVCNITGVNGGNGEEVILMGAGDLADEVTIPSAFMKKSDCDLIKIAINNGEEVIISARDRPISGPRSFDSNFDNGIILHEYAHGISTRLTGGPSQPSCLPTFRDSDGSNPRGEQMGEGWSDFFGLIWTTKVGQVGSDPKGIGTYVSGEESSGRGIRSFPYCTDMSINPLTYDDIKISSVPHGVGTVWASILWDMYWRFIDRYGFDPDWRNTESGNYRATYLVMEGMKLQPCRPGFVDGREAILEADRLNYNGMHERLIWEVFARRGVGYYAEQGSTSDHRDGSENFDMPPLLIEELKIEKTGNQFATPGEEISFRIKVTNHIPSTQTNVVVEDILPEGLTYVDGSSDITPTVENGKMIFDLGTMPYLEEKIIEYRLLASPDITSEQLYYDDVESGENGWTVRNLVGSATWQRSTNRSLSGRLSWYSEEVENQENSQILISPPIKVRGENPTFRFWHRYAVSPAVNGGYVEISNDGGETWNPVSDDMTVRNSYPGELSFFAFAIPELEGFTGDSDRKFIDTYIDLQNYVGQEIQVRFLFANSSGPTSSEEAPGWYIDDLELIDLNTYISQACTYSQEDQEKRCTALDEIVINTNTVTSIIENEFSDYGIHIFPNPANDFCYINLSDSHLLSGTLYMVSMEGKLVEQYDIPKGEKQIALDLRDYNAGNYILLIKSQEQLITQKLIITH